MRAALVARGCRGNGAGNGAPDEDIPGLLSFAGPESAFGRLGRPQAATPAAVSAANTKHYPPRVVPAGA